MKRPPGRLIRRVVETALREDVGRGDITTRALVSPRAQAEGIIYARQPCVVCGLDAARAAFPRARIAYSSRDGRHVSAGAPLLRVRGSVHTILAGERVALNFMQRLSGIATLTAEFVRRVKGTRAIIMDTRKTTPGLRELEKYAVRCGGGVNHRRGLDDAVLIKDNHLSFIHDRTDLAAILRRLKSRARLVEIEAQSMDHLTREIELPVDIIMLDNFDIPHMRRAVEFIRRRRPDVKIEASGGVNLENVRPIAETGVDRISIGALTHSPRAVNLSLDIR